MTVTEKKQLERNRKLLVKTIKSLVNNDVNSTVVKTIRKLFKNTDRTIREQARQHVFKRCQHEDGLEHACCNLAYCEVCKCGEGELPTHCPGLVLDDAVRNAIYNGGLDFYKGNWRVRYCKHGRPVKGSRKCSCGCRNCNVRAVAVKAQKFLK